jgi:hypothetical protein
MFGTQVVSGGGLRIRLRGKAEDAQRVIDVNGVGWSGSFDFSGDFGRFIGSCTAHFARPRKSV